MGFNLDSVMVIAVEILGSCGGGGALPPRIALHELSLSMQFIFENRTSDHTKVVVAVVRRCIKRGFELEFKGRKAASHGPFESNRV